MPRTRVKNDAYLGGNRSGKQGRVIDYRMLGERITKRPDPNIDRKGYAPCATCGYWVLLRVDGTVRAHATNGQNVTRKNVPCIGADGRTGEEWATRQQEMRRKGGYPPIDYESMDKPEMRRPN